MPPRSQPTARQERLGAELRKLREAAGMTAREAAALLGTNPMHMSHLETGRAGISEERLRRLAANCECSDAKLIDALVAMATDRTRGWWEEYRGVLPAVFLDQAELEHHALGVRDISVVGVPGLLQTEHYARAVFSFRVPELPSKELEPRVEHRMRRRSILERDPGTPYEGIIHEAALRIRVGTRETALAQLHSILEFSERDNVAVRVIPMEAEQFAGAYSVMLLAAGAVPSLDTLQRDVPDGTGFMTAEAQLVKARAMFDKVKAFSLGTKATRDLVREVMRNL
ncbi:helix-turn-helix domain-containing protein [Streptomyces boncukensis]|uniref:Helix-turn-helix transcriptional regulator n=1 Tax=Streptomyces boncukensis TaxID=2711219 RepID=A0A6G4X531_9ACTN|nr:helix-turn-helix transcriptional regulator [Streptomyces boncukensis]NGO72646.1 helix-turn-helix transcriptional regulator [Streptomyces boncukensis]